MDELLKKVYFGNTVLQYLIATGIILLGMLIVFFLKHVVLKKIKRWSEHTKTHFDDFLVEGIRRFIIPILYFTAIYLGLLSLTLSQKMANILKVATTIFITYFILRLISAAVSGLLQNYLRRQVHGEEKVKQLGGIMLLINIVIWIMGFLFLFDNMGYNITTILTGLGIGGIAIALAAQNILGDLFNYFVIFFDKPFEIGDYIVIDDKQGNVDYIGIKTTRIKSLTGEQLVISNSDLTSSRIHNYKRMEKRRISFKIGVTYSTSLELLKQIPAIIRSIIEIQETADFDRAHFTSYNESSLDYEIVYHVLDGDYTKYMDIQQAINLRIFEEFQNLGIEFAFPTRTLFIEKEPKEKSL
ncbi:MAG: mechanosensitive ion channel family protein [Chitinophagaceae bacterium]|nr:mechanosensitive ion channel family protein [Chitinophagaceae bacterium]